MKRFCLLPLMLLACTTQKNPTQLYVPPEPTECIRDSAQAIADFNILYNMDSELGCVRNTYPLMLENSSKNRLVYFCAGRDMKYRPPTITSSGADRPRSMMLQALGGTNLDLNAEAALTEHGYLEVTPTKACCSGMAQKDTSKYWHCVNTALSDTLFESGAGLFEAITTTDENGGCELPGDLEAQALGFMCNKCKSGVAKKMGDSYSAFCSKPHPIIETNTLNFANFCIGNGYNTYVNNSRYAVEGSRLS